MKKKVLLSSIMTIALCLCLIAGSTFALFTSQSEVNIAVNSGKVNMVASMSDLKLYSVIAAPEGATDTVIDENGNAYVYEEQTEKEMFLNTGTAEIKESLLEIKKITPGDKVSFVLSGANNSNVAIQYRYVIECIEGQTLMSGFVVTVNEEDFEQPIATEALNSYTSVWTSLAENDDMDPVTIDVELPVTAGNEYQELDAKIKITVEAVQGNAVVDDNETPVITVINKAATSAELQAAINDSSVDYVYLIDNAVDTPVNISGAVSNKTIDANGYNALLTIKADATLDNVVIKNLIDDANDGNNAIYVESGASGTLTVSDSSFYDASSTWGGIHLRGNTELTLNVENCHFENGRYGVYSAGSVGTVNVIGCTIVNSGSWAIQYNGTAKGNIVVDGCTFNNCVGILKAAVGGGEGNSGLIDGNLTFTNNIMNNCSTKNNVYADTDTAGTITFENNTMDGDLVVVGDMLGMN